MRNSRSYFIPIPQFAAFKFISCLGAAAVFAIAYAGAAAAQRSPVPIVDTHVHIMPDDNKSFDAAFAAALQTMDTYGIARAVIMSPPRSRRVKLNFDHAEFQSVLSRHAGRFSFLAGGGTLNLTLHSAAASGIVTEEMKRQFADTAQQAISSGASGFGEMSSLHISLHPSHGYSYVTADHPLLLVLADVAAESDVPIDLHMDAVVSEMAAPARLVSFPNNPLRFPATIDALERLLAHNRRAKIVWAHGGSDHLGAMTPNRIRGLMDKHTNLFMSLRPVPPIAPVENKLLSGQPPMVDPQWMALLKRYSDRFMIGTDGFYVGASAGGGPVMEFAGRNETRLRATVRFLSLLPHALARKIGAENAIRIYRLPATRNIPSQSAAPSGVSRPASQGRLCIHGNLEHCRLMCNRGKKAACARLGR